jgi:hypothetical protein
LWNFSTSGLNLIQNGYYDGSNYKYVATAAASQYSQSAGAHTWFTAPSGTAGNAISFTQMGTLTSTGLGLGASATSPGQLLTLRPASGNFYTSFVGDASATMGLLFGTSGNTVDGQVIYSNSTQVMSFVTASAERARFTPGGYFKASNDGTYSSPTGSTHELRQSANNTTAEITNTHVSDPYGIYAGFTAASPDNNSNWFLRCDDSTATRCYIYSDGDLANHDGVYGTISDERLKQDITDASSQWNDLKAVRFRKYRMKTDVIADANAPYQLGVIAQELAQTSPGLVDEHPNDDGTTTKTVKSSILLMKAAVALQEAMIRIETLEQRVMALEN